MWSCLALKPPYPITVRLAPAVIKGLGNLVPGYQASIRRTYIQAALWGATTSNKLRQLSLDRSYQLTTNQDTIFTSHPSSRLTHAGKVHSVLPT